MDQPARICIPWVDGHMPSVTLRTKNATDEKEESLTEYICDWPDCPNVAEHVVGVLVELRAFCAVCTTHAKLIASRRSH
jgi:hypothetical protein